MTDFLFQKDRTQARIDQVLRMPLEWRQRRVLELLVKHMGFARAITIKDIGGRLHMQAREIKSVVAGLRAAPYRLPICASRSGEHGGYYFAATEEERKEASRLLVNQAESMLETARDLMEPHELHGAFAAIRALVGEGSRG